jgi:hypothetical protein
LHVARSVLIALGIIVLCVLAMTIADVAITLFP